MCRKPLNSKKKDEKLDNINCHKSYMLYNNEIVYDTCVHENDEIQGKILDEFL